MTEYRITSAGGEERIVKKREYGRNVRTEHEHKRDERGEGGTIKAGCRGWEEVKQKAEENEKEI